MTMNTRPRAFWLILVLSCMLAIFLAGCAGKNAGSASDAAPPAIAEDVAKNQAKAGAALSSSAAGGSLASAGAADDFEDYGDEDEPVIADPLQPWNRFWFKFNDVLLIDVVKPVHKGYTAVVPQPFRNGISNVFHNLKAPVRIVNRLLQGEFAQMWVEIGRFIVNSTLGGGGLWILPKKTGSWFLFRKREPILALRLPYGASAKDAISSGRSWVPARCGIPLALWVMRRLPPSSGERSPVDLSMPGQLQGRMAG